MQIALRLFPENPIWLEFSYYPKLASSIYQIISAADSEFTQELHDGDAYRNRIKLFGFSPLYSRQTEVHPKDQTQDKAGGLLFKGSCTFTVCSPLPELMTRLGEGLSKTSQLRIGSQFIHLQGVMLIPMPYFKEKMIWRLRRPSSCVTSWSSKEEKVKHYVLPGASIDGQTCEALLRENLIHKWRRLKEIRPDIAEAWLRNGTTGEQKLSDFTENDVRVRWLPLSAAKQVHRKKHYIKKAPVLSWIASLEITAPPAIQRIAWSCGLGEMNSMGFGVVEEVIQ